MIDVYYSFEQHATTLFFHDVILTLKLIYCVELFYVFVISFIKFSVLLFYRRIFSNKRFEIILWCIEDVLAIWTIVIILLFVFQCSFISKIWKFFFDDQCIDIDKLIFDNAIFQYCDWCFYCNSFFSVDLKIENYFASKFSRLRNLFFEWFVNLPICELEIYNWQRITYV